MNINNTFFIFIYLVWPIFLYLSDVHLCLGMNVLQGEEVTTPKHTKPTVSPLFWQNTAITSARTIPEHPEDNLPFGMSVFKHNARMTNKYWQILVLHHKIRKLRRISLLIIFTLNYTCKIRVRKCYETSSGKDYC